MTKTEFDTLFAQDLIYKPSRKNQIINDRIGYLVAENDIIAKDMERLIRYILEDRK